MVNTGIPIALGVLTCQTIEQAQERSGGAVGNKGHDCNGRRNPTGSVDSSSKRTCHLTDSPQNMRRAALQCLYQFDSSTDIGDEVVRESLRESPGSEADHDEALRLAREAWAVHTQADEMATEFAEDWPTQKATCC